MRSLISCPVALQTHWILVLCVFLTGNAIAEDAIVNGGQSPDGRYEVRIVESDDPKLEPSNYLYEVIDAKSGKVVQALDEGGGYSLYEEAKETASVVWHSSGNFFALVDHGTRHSMDLYVYEIDHSKVTLLKLPDYMQNALGRVNSTQGYGIEVVKPLKWDGDILACNLTFDAYVEVNGKRGRSPTYVTQFQLQLFHGPNMASYLMLYGMAPPVDSE